MSGHASEMCKKRREANELLFIRGYVNAPIDDNDPNALAHDLHEDFVPIADRSLLRGPNNDFRTFKPQDETAVARESGVPVTIPSVPKPQVAAERNDEVAIHDENNKNTLKSRIERVDAELQRIQVEEDVLNEWKELLRQDKESATKLLAFEDVFGRQ